MARYINAEKTIEIINSEIEQCKLELEDEDEEEEAYTRAVNARLLGLINCLEIIKSQPTADVVEVVHAEWVFSRTVSEMISVKCSKCGTEQFAIAHYVQSGNYCPYCGAKMDKERDHNGN